MVQRRQGRARNAHEMRARQRAEDRRGPRWLFTSGETRDRGKRGPEPYRNCRLYLPRARDRVVGVLAGRRGRGVEWANERTSVQGKGVKGRRGEGDLAYVQRTRRLC
jgi:hypothetical protein